MNPSVAFHAPEGEGASRVRSFFPAQALEDRGWDVVASEDPPEFGRWDIVVIHRPLSRVRPMWVRDHQQAGSIVLVQEDDDLGAVAQARTLHPDSLALLSPNILETHAQAIREADGLIYTSDALKDVYGKLNPRSWQIRNYLPKWVGTCQWGNLRSDVDIKVGWAGITNTHRDGLEWIRPVIDELLYGAKFTTVGDHRTPQVLGVNGLVEAWPYEWDINRYYKCMSRADVGIVPLDPSVRFNLAKTSLKAQEYAALGIPVVVTNLPEQEWWVEHGVTGFLADTPAEFAEYVQNLVWDLELREEMGAAAKAKADANVIEVRVTEWEAVLIEAAQSRKVRRASLGSGIR